MHLVRFESGDGESWGVHENEQIRDLGKLLRTCPTILDAIQDWENIGPQLADLASDAPLLPATTRLMSPVPEVGKTICIGLNYRDHAIETGAAIPTEPVVFNKLKGCLCGPEDPIPLPAVSQQVDFEAELVLVIGKRAWNVPESTAEEHIFGYMCGHDVSARDWQKGRPGGQWLLGKSFPNFGPVGPFLVPRERITDACSLNICMRINGEVFQQSNTQQLIFNPRQLIAHLSQCFVLEPGDVIFTGTPPGVGMARDPQRFLKPGDVCEVEIEGLGTLRNPVTDSLR